MSIVERSRNEFRPKLRQVGELFVTKNRVKVLGVLPDRVIASVRETAQDSYQVGIRWKPDQRDHLLESYCECRRANKGFLCPHVWAVILKVQEDHTDVEVPGSGDLQLLPLWNGEQLFDPDEDVRLQHQNAAKLRESNGGTKTAPPKLEKWDEQLKDLLKLQSQVDKRVPIAAQIRRAWFRINTDASKELNRLVIEFFQQEQRRDGKFGQVKRVKLTPNDLVDFPDELDRELLDLMFGSMVRQEVPQYLKYLRRNEAYSDCVLSPAIYPMLLPMLCKSERFGFIETKSRMKNKDPHVLKWAGAEPWKFAFDIELDAGQDAWKLGARLERSDGETVPLKEVSFVTEGIVAYRDQIGLLDDTVPHDWIQGMVEVGAVQIPTAHEERLVEVLWQVPQVDQSGLHEDLQWDVSSPIPVPYVQFSRPKSLNFASDLYGRVAFDYKGWKVPAMSKQSAYIIKEERQVIQRNHPAEKAMLESLMKTGVRRAVGGELEEADCIITRKKLSKSVRELLQLGWFVEAEGHKYKRPGTMHLNVSSGVDWFDLQGTVEFDGQTIELPRLIQALKHGEEFVKLSDGSQGILPADWLAKYAPLAAMGQVVEDGIRFQSSQAVILDALLAAQENVETDDRFEQVQNLIQSFKGVDPLDQPETFEGELREYQREGLGWMDFLNQFGFGGCLADDMGLGKTIQVLAMLESNRQKNLEKKEHKTNLIVVPRSLVYNWSEESSRFTPELKVLEYTGPNREELIPEFADADIVITTYGTLRRDITKLREFEFDYAILDESQAIKNANSQAAKSCRIINSRRKLAMTGTPVENHLGELWSLFEFLNPGMLGKLSQWKHLSTNRSEDQDTIGLVAKAVRPFLLRRTKKQVLTELPDKTEKTLFCELSPEQRALYDELREHYRASLNQKIEAQGMGKSKIHVLEALLRLRQAACHPALLNGDHDDLPSAKLDILVNQLLEIIEEGHKALIFSQFTSFLSLLRERLDEAGCVYEYLDGRTRKRAPRVKRFQEDPDCPLFLISLKAGGMGLNLTAADYVFILDPWWNPAVEAQAVDRAHRIGQEKHVFAYRLIARNTVEEKILQLQGEKKQLADAIISEDNSLVSKLTHEDLELLLS